MVACDDKPPSDQLYGDPGAWRIEPARLQEAWSASIRSRRPRFLSFVHARQWARAMWFSSEEDWLDWLDRGEKRNCYIPSNPDVIYADKCVHQILTRALALVGASRGLRGCKLLRGAFYRFPFSQVARLGRLLERRVPGRGLVKRGLSQAPGAIDCPCTISSRQWQRVL